MCFDFVCSFCVLILWAALVFWFCVQLLYYDFVCSFLVLILCAAFVFWFCVQLLCFDFVCSCCVLILCFDLVCNFCVLILCADFVLILCAAFVFWFCVQLLSATVTTVARTVRDAIKDAIRFHWSTQNSCQILKKIEISRQIFEKSSNINFHKIPSSGSRVCSMRTDRQTWRN